MQTEIFLCNPGKYSLSRKTVCLLALTVFPLPASADTSSGTYAYDEDGRLQTAFYENEACISYSYDANGNRTAQMTTQEQNPTSAKWGESVYGCAYWTAP